MNEQCPVCGYTEFAATFWMDHHLCKNSGNAPWEKKPFVPREPVVIHGPLPKDLPQFEGIDYPIGGKPREKAERE